MDQKAIDGLVSDHEIWFKENDKGSKLSLSDKKIEGVSFSLRKLHDAEFKKIDFHKCDFTATKLFRSKMNDCTFTECEFNQAHLSDSKMDGVKISSSSMDKARLDGIIAKKIDIRSTSMKESFWAKADITDVIFDNCDFINSVFLRVDALRTTISDSTLTSCDFTKAMFIDGLFQKCNIADSVFDRSSFRGVKFSNLVGKPKSWLDSRFVDIQYDKVQNQSNPDESTPW